MACIPAVVEMIDVREMCEEYELKRVWIRLTSLFMFEFNRQVRLNNEQIYVRRGGLGARGWMGAGS